MIQSAYRLKRQVDDLTYAIPYGHCLEAHSDPNGGGLNVIACREVADFIECWRGAPGINPTYSPDLLARTPWIGVVHADGVFLVAVDEAAYRDFHFDPFCDLAEGGDR